MTLRGWCTAVLLSSAVLGLSWCAPPAFAVAPACTRIAEEFESGTLGPFTSTVIGDAPGWSVVTTAAVGGTHSAFAPSLDRVTDQRLTVTNPIVVPIGMIGGHLSFFHRYQLEEAFDGAVLETSIDGGATWQEAVITNGGYNGALGAGANPLAGRNVWTGSSPGYPGFTGVFVDLEPFEGQTVVFRFRLATDESVGEAGWWIDTIELILGLPCEAIPTATPTPTVTVTPTATASSTPEPTATASATPIPSATPSVTATPVPTASPSPGPLDHFLCYETHRRQINVKGVTLDDDRGASTVVVRQARRLCAPANKNGEDPTAPSHPGHLTTYTIRQSAPQFARVKGLAIEDQFGSHTVDLIRPERVLVPTAKSTVSSPPPLAIALDHFKCYRVRSRRVQVPTATVETQFGALTVSIRRPRHLCLPADKNDEGIQDPRVGLMCYQVRPTTMENTPRVFSTDQFGSAEYGLFNIRDLCVPLVAGPGVCGDGALNAPGEECESGAGNDAACAGDCDTATCTCDAPSGPVCGDGTLDPTEQCEVASDCLVGCVARGGCLTRGVVAIPFTCEGCQCIPGPFCGDGNLDPDEQCDESNAACPNATDVCRECSCCQPLLECPAGACGNIPNGCGSTISCGGCAAPLVCSANNVCECEGVCEFGEPDPVTCTCIE